MVAADEQALICDFAETYHVFDYKALPVTTAALLASGLRENSRIKMILAGITVSQDTLLLASAVDALHVLVWTKTKDAQHGRNRPKSIAQALLKKSEPIKDRIAVFGTPEEFERALSNAKGGETHGN